MLANLPRSHPAVQASRLRAETLSLNRTRCEHLFAHRGTASTVAGLRQVFKRHRRNFNMQVDTIQERSGNAPDVLLDCNRRAFTRLLRIAEKTTRARVHRGTQHEVRRERRRMRRAADRYAALFERLPE